jgi:hypothetical protein
LGALRWIELGSERQADGERPYARVKALVKASFEA